MRPRSIRGALALMFPAPRSRAAHPKRDTVFLCSRRPSVGLTLKTEKVYELGLHVSLDRAPVVSFFPSGRPELLRRDSHRAATQQHPAVVTLRSNAESKAPSMISPFARNASTHHRSPHSHHFAQRKDRHNLGCECPAPVVRSSCQQVAENSCGHSFSHLHRGCQE